MPRWVDSSHLSLLGSWNYKILHPLRRNGYREGEGEGCKSTSQWMLEPIPRRAYELSAFWEVAVPEEWRNLIAQVVTRASQANGALRFLNAEGLCGPFCVKFLF